MITDLENETPKVPVKPIPAATVISLRDSATGMEVLMAVSYTHLTLPTN